MSRSDGKQEHWVIVGAGQAAAQCIETLRRRGHRGPLTLVGEEPVLPYHRPPLSKKYLAGELTAERLLIRAESFYREHAVTLQLGKRALAIDRPRAQLLIEGHGALAYDRLILATGARPRPLALPGLAQAGTLAGVQGLRNLADTDSLRSAVAKAQRITIVGGGYIGLEVAATLRQRGQEVTVLEMAERVMNRVVAEPVSRFYEAAHRNAGVQLQLNTRLEALESHDGRLSAIVLASQNDPPKRLSTDLLIVGIGVLPNEELAREAGLDCDNGIIVDEFCRTSDPQIYAIGDCCNHPSLHYGRRVRLESVDNAFEQANTLAANLLDTPTPHDRIPWFWSDQYAHKLLIVGLSQGHDEIILRGKPEAGAFSCCYLREGELLAIDTVNMARDQMAARKLIPLRWRPDRNRLSDPGIALKDCV